MRILVSGASGFIGSGLASVLAQQGHEICALMRTTATAEFLKGTPFTRIAGDIRDQDSLNRACENVDAVIHLAGILAAQSRDEFFRFNAEGTKNLASAAAKSGNVKRFIYVSSLAAAGPSAGLAPRQEADPEVPVSFYGESKLRGELYLDEFRGKLPYVVIRPPIVYGPRDRGLYTIFKTIQRNWMPTMPAKSTTGHKYYSAIHVDDLIQSIICALNGPEHFYTTGDRFFVSDGNIYTMDRIMELIAQELKVKPIRIKVPEGVMSIVAMGGTLLGKVLKRSLPLNSDKMKELMPDYWICSSQKAIDKLSYKPKYTMESGIPQTVAWYKVNGWL